MIELSFVVCLAAAPSDCRTERLQFVNVSPMTCLVGAQAQLASWQERHPGWEIRRWTCRTRDPSSAAL